MMWAYMQLSAIFLLAVVTLNGQTNAVSLCQFFEHLNCTVYVSGVLCGTNDVTYPNHCEFYKAHCSDKNILVKKDGPCPNARADQLLVLSMVCRDLLSIDCDLWPDAVEYCATDGNTYRTACHFEQKRCQSPSLRLRHSGRCSFY